MQDAKLYKFTFAVAKDAHKNQVKKAVEEYFKVNVKKINLLKIKGKLKKVGKLKRKTIKEADWKKAVVQVKEGQKIDLFEIAQGK
ncbi:50S ribosomal protein L23 [Candidatus Beckwithbacteria bacterium RBG_13_35_6]|uniref:50S ribosomal protein L23 n=1 Tax=Candidatus Beckwithbacteria bacterium RBG_13_35_6 TaxID=1797456 RepID=A0A1F5DFT6_9BACT|nr:MAG: 50S ribosomal protein L23 [Candidatus Beckwithbacteria bacterium RBG_13_35_6]